MPAHIADNPQKNTPRRILILALGVLFALCGATLAWASTSGVFTPNTASNSDQEVAPPTKSDSPIPGETAEPVEPVVPEPEPEPEPVDITIAAAGDILPHMPVLNSASTSEGYDMSRLWSRLDPWISGADLSLCHMEVPIAPPGSAPSGYPMFAAPHSIARDIADAGWDGCSTASNHSVDRGFPGVEATLDAFEEVGLGASGTARSEEEADQPQIYTLERAERTVKIAHLSAAYGLNGLPKPEGKPWAVETFDAEAPDLTRLLEQAERARADGADLVIASIHCCVEYQTEPTPAQKNVMQEIADSQLIDLVIGHHAHVPQPIEELKGGPDNEGMWVAYGLGNYISNQSAECCVPQTSNGLVMFASAHIPHEGPVRVTGVEWLAVTVDRADGHQLHPISEETEAFGRLNGAQIASRFDLVMAAVGSQSPEIARKPEPSGPAPVVVPRVSGAASGEDDLD